MFSELASFTWPTYGIEILKSYLGSTSIIKCIYYAKFNIFLHHFIIRYFDKALVLVSFSASASKESYVISIFLLLISIL